MRHAIWGALASLLVGLGLIGYSLYNAATYLDLVQSGIELKPERISVGEDWNYAHYTVNGQNVVCVGDFDRGDWIVYDPSNPSRCRPDWAVGWMDSNEGLGVSVGLFCIVVSVVMFILWAFAGGEDELDRLMREPPPR